MNKLNKTPNEQYTVELDFASKLPTGAALSSGVLSVREVKTGKVVSDALLVSTTATINADVAQATIKGGEVGRVYKLTYLVTLDNTDVLEEDVLVSVVDDL